MKNDSYPSVRQAARSTTKPLDYCLRLLKFSAFILIFGGCTDQSQSAKSTTSGPSGKAQTSAVTDAQPGRDFRSLSVSPDGEELFFVEVDERLPEHSRILRYDLKNNGLRHYALPKGYVYTDAKLSPSGKFIVMKRVVEVPENDDTKVRESLGNPELVIMHADGTDFRTIKLNEGFKHAPILSNDDSKVAYWRGSLRPPNSKSLASRLDIWEVDLKTGLDTPFAGLHEYFEGGQMQYLRGDNEILYEAYGPRAFAQSMTAMTAYDKRYNRSNIYRSSRGQTTLTEPILTEVNGSMFPMLDKVGTIYWDGQRPSRSFFRKTDKGEIELWVIPSKFANMIYTCVAPSGTYVAFIYPILGTRSSVGKRSIGVFEIQTLQWRTLNIPPLNISSPIVVELTQ